METGTSSSSLREGLERVRHSLPTVHAVVPLANSPMQPVVRNLVSFDAVLGFLSALWMCVRVCWGLLRPRTHAYRAPPHRLIAPKNALAVRVKRRQNELCGGGGGGRAL